MNEEEEMPGLSLLGATILFFLSGLFAWTVFQSTQKGGYQEIAVAVIVSLMSLGTAIGGIWMIIKMIRSLFSQEKPDISGPRSRFSK